MSQINFVIRAFNEAEGQVIVEFDGIPPMAIDLVLDENGNVPEGDELDAAIRSYFPVWIIERRNKLAAGIPNAASVHARVVPFPPLPEEPAPPFEQPTITGVDDLPV